MMKARGPQGEVIGGATGFVTVHPSLLLRIPDPAARRAAFAAFTADLAAVRALAAA